MPYPSKLCIDAPGFAPALRVRFRITELGRFGYYVALCPTQDRVQCLKSDWVFCATHGFNILLAESNFCGQPYIILREVSRDRCADQGDRGFDTGRDV